MFKQRTINFKLRVHTMPDDLRPPLPPEREHLAGTSAAYQRAIDADEPWPVHSIDDRNRLCVLLSEEVRGDQTVLELLDIDEGTYERVDCDPYEIISDEPGDGTAI